MKLSIRRIPLRIRVAVMVAVAAICVRIALPGPPAATLRGVAGMLGESVGGKVRPGDFLWEGSRGVVADALLGRRVLFLARTAPDAPRDLFRAAVRVTLEGKPVAVRDVVNLTTSPFGDDQGLVGNGSYVAYATVAFGAVQQVTLLDLHGQPPPQGGAVNRLMALLTNVKSTGSLDGLGRTEVSTNVRAQTVGLTLDDRLLGVAIDGDRARLTISLDTGLVMSREGQQVAASPMRVPQLSKPPILWLVDTVRSVTGPEFVAWLEDHAFDAQDLVKRAGYRAFSDGEEVAEVAAGPVAPPSPPSEPEEVGADGFVEDRAWPPQNLRTIWKKPDEREGVWNEPRHKFLQKNEVPGAKQPAPSYFYQTYVRPDPKRPWSKVWMVAMDSRQLELGMEGGIDDPQPLTGARGEGRIPQDPRVLHRAVGAFNGGFKTTHGEYGMMVARRILLPPKPGSATIFVNDQGLAGFGTWPVSDAIPQDMVSFRQNLEPLVDGGRLNPTERRQWGWHLHTTGMLTHRSGLCLTSTGHMVYAWGPEVTGETLGNAMIQAGCTYAVHLDMNPRHTAFAYVDARKRHRAELLHPGMQTLAERFIVWSPKDFFYLTLRRFGPPPVSGVEFEADEGTHPTPDWAPSVYQGTLTIQGTRVELKAFTPDRAEFHLHAGGDGEEKLDPKVAGRVLAAMVTGAGTGSPLALHVGDKREKRHSLGAILYVHAGKLRVVGPKESLPKEADWFELPLLATGDATVRATERGRSRKRTGICTTSDGFVWVGRAQASSDGAVAAALKQAGCGVIASLDRGTERPTRVYRSGTDHPPVDRYDVPTIYVLGTPLRPGAFQWRASP